MDLFKALDEFVSEKVEYEATRNLIVGKQPPRMSNLNDQKIRVEKTKIQLKKEVDLLISQVTIKTILENIRDLGPLLQELKETKNSAKSAVKRGLGA